MGYQTVLLLTFALCSLLSIANAGPKICSVIQDEKAALKVVDGDHKPMVAQATFVDDNFNTTGWSTLKVVTNGSCTDPLQAEAAGMAEGYITSEFIYMDYMNKFVDYCKKEEAFCKKLAMFVDENLSWINGQVKQSKDSEKAYWHQVDLVYKQLEGIKSGYASSKQPKIDDFGFTLMQIDGDLEDLEVALGKKTLRRAVGEGHCSAFIKVLPKNADLMVSQVTWNDFVSMLRIFKLYEFGFHKLDSQGGTEKIPLIPGNKVSFSSYPSMLFSGDDFHVLGSQLVTQETTIGNGNKDLWQYVKPSSVLEWVRTIVANRLAASGSEWAYLFEKYNSGTYNNQWMIVDYKLFKPGSPLVPNTLWILEQIPGTVMMADMTMKLIDETYWSSYNLPYFPFIYEKSGVGEQKAKYGSWFDYKLNPRSQIFRRDHSKVIDVQTLLKLMRYNDFKHDPLSACKNCTPPYSAENAISARSDLNPADGKYPFSALGHRKHGGTDCKATNFKLVRELSAWVVAGPTHDQQPVFKWSTSGWKKPMGHPDEFNFKEFVLSWK